MKLFIFAGCALSVSIVLLSFSPLNAVLAQRQSPPDQAFQFHHITLSVNDADQVSNWYADVLGFTIRDRFTLTRPTGDTIQIVRVETPGLMMNISQFEGSVSPDRTGERQGWRHLALQVEDVDRTYQQLRSQGVEFITEPFTYDPPGYRVVFFRDIEGNVVELYQE